MKLVSIIILILLEVLCVTKAQENVIACGGFIKSNTEINYKIIKVKLLTKDGNLKYLSEASPVNGYYMIPVYAKGEYILQVNPPPGWSFEPNQVALNVDGVNDPCSKNEDINFMFKGFGLSGKVVTLGDPQQNGPEAIKLNLISNNEVIDTTQSAHDGSYYFSNIMPGAYQVQAQDHPNQKFKVSKINVILSKENWSAKENIIISGYTIEGLVTTLDKSPISGAKVELFFSAAAAQNEFSQIPTQDFKCDFSSTAAAGSICHTTSDQQGRFTFANVAFAKYELRTSLTLKNGFHFGFVPERHIVDLTIHKSQVLDKAFVLNTVTINSQIVLKQNNLAIEQAQIYVNSKKTSNQISSTGQVTLANLTSGAYTIGIKNLKNVHFEEKQFNVDLTSQACLQSESPQFQSLTSLLKFVPKSFDVCGRVSLGKGGVQAKDFVRLVRIKSVSADQNSHDQKVATLDQNLNYCLQLDANSVYTIRAQLDDSTGSSSQIKLVPEERRINLVDEPIFNVNFEQLEASLEAQIRFLPGAEIITQFKATLKSLDENRQWQQEIELVNCTSDNLSCKFKVINLLFGKYALSTNYDDLYCWKKAYDIKEDFATISIQSETQQILIEQVGFKLNYELSHKNVHIKLENDSNDKNKFLFETDIATDPQRTGAVCVPRAVNLNLFIESCHQFTKSGLVQIKGADFFRREKNFLKLTSQRVQVDVEIKFKFEDAGKSDDSGDDLIVEVAQASGEIELVTFKLKAKTAAEKSTAFEGKGWFKPNELIRLKAKSKRFLFEINEKELLVSEDKCELNRVEFEATLGIFLVGTIKTKSNDVDLINLVVKSSQDDEIVIYSSAISSLNGFRVGPLKSPSTQYKVELSKESYLFTPTTTTIQPNPPRDEHHFEFTAQKLGQLKVTVQMAIDTTTKLENALVSLSSADRSYRQSLKTNSDGLVSFDNLKPALYYLIVIMQEHQFTPNSHPIEITDGVHINLQVEAKRIAYSCFGRVTSINGQAVEADAAASHDSTIQVEARGRGQNNDDDICQSSVETSRLEPSLGGTYRIFNLIPKCWYDLSVKNLKSTAAASLTILPQKFELTVDAADTFDKNFVVLVQADRLDLTMAVSFRPKETRNGPLNYKELNNFVRLRLFKTSQADSILQTLIVPANTVAYFNSLPLNSAAAAAEEYSVQVELLQSSSLTPFQHGPLSQQQQLALQQQTVLQKTELSFYTDTTTMSHKHLSVSFDEALGGFSKNNNNNRGKRDDDEYQTFYFTVPIFLIVIGILLNSNKVMQQLGNLNSILQQRGGLVNFFQSFFASSTKTTTSAASIKSTTSKSANMQQKTSSTRAKDSDASSKPSPRQQKVSTVTAEDTAAASALNTDDFNIDDYETVNIDPADDAPPTPELISLANSTIKRKAKRI
jgi:hypothetical protein